MMAGERSDIMNIEYYPSEYEVNEAIRKDDPMLAAISFDAKTAILSPSDAAFEHHILLMMTKRSAADIDHYFRIVFDKAGADWTFVCPPDYKNIPIESRRVTAFYKNGIDAITEFLKIIGYPINIDIPRRYRGQLEVIGKTKPKGNDVIFL